MKETKHSNIGVSIDLSGQDQGQIFDDVLDQTPWLREYLVISKEEQGGDHAMVITTKSGRQIDGMLLGQMHLRQLQMRSRKPAE